MKGGGGGKGFQSRKQKPVFLSRVSSVEQKRSDASTHRNTNRKQCKMSSSKKLTCRGTFRQVFICLRPRTPYPPPVHTVYLFAQERGGGGTEPERRREGQQFTKLGKKYQHD
jgi:hypothetical protein